MKKVVFTVFGAWLLLVLGTAGNAAWAHPPVTLYDYNGNRIIDQLDDGDTVTAANGGEKRDPLTGEPILEAPCGSFTIAEAGSMSPEEFDTAMYDLVNFLAYTAEPIKAERERLGVFVLLFITLFFVFAWLLNREYWKDVH